MEKLVDEGKVRYIGVSNFSLSQTREAEESLSKHELISNQVEYSLKARTIEPDLLPYSDKNGIVIVAYRPVAHGAPVSFPEIEVYQAVSGINSHAGGSISWGPQPAGYTPRRAAGPRYLYWCIGEERSPE